MGTPSTTPTRNIRAQTIDLQMSEEAKAILNDGNAAMTW
jgi:hypothetical protein